MYNLIEYSDNHSNKFGSLWHETFKEQFTGININEK